MESALIDKIKQKKKKCYFISPHFDDAILSAGAVLFYLSKHTDVTVINVFTEGGEKPYTLSAKQYLKQCGYTNAEELYRDRKKEDKEVLGNIVKTTINLGFTDALWRKKEKNHILGKYIPEFNTIYPTYKFHIIKGAISEQDKNIVSKISSQLTSIIDKKSAIIFCPIGIGNHIDHVIVKEVCTSLFKNLIYWSDFPYDEKNILPKEITNKNTFRFPLYLKEKATLIEGYKTQFKAMFKQGLTTKAETYYTALTPEQL